MRVLAAAQLRPTPCILCCYFLMESSNPCNRGLWLFKGGIRGCKWGEISPRNGGKIRSLLSQMNKITARTNLQYISTC